MAINLYNQYMDKEFYMNMALDLAKEAFLAGETPVGCVITGPDGEILGQGRNEAAAKKNTLYHAEIIAINEASGKIGDFRLNDCTMYVTIEPCPMCAGAIVMSRIGTLVYGAKNPKAGCAGSVLNILDNAGFNHRVKVSGGVLAQECGSLMTEFFRENFRKHSNCATEAEVFCKNKPEENP